MWGKNYYNLHDMNETNDTAYFKLKTGKVMS